MFDTYYFSSIIFVISLFNTMGENNTDSAKLTPDERQIAKSVSTDIFNPQIWLQMKGMAEVFIQSKAIPLDSAAKAITVMQAGREMGMAPMQSINSLYIVNGQINFWGKNLVRRLREFGWRINYKNETDDSVTAVVTNTKDPEEVYEETYTFAEAEKSGYTSGSNGLKVGWRAGINRKKKLRYGALQLIVHTYIPEVLGTAVGIVEVSEDIEYENVTEVKQEVKPTAEKEDNLKEFLNKSKESETKKVTKKAKEKVNVTESIEAEVVDEKPVEEKKEKKEKIEKMVTPEQLKKIATLCTVKKLDREKIKADLGVTSAKELTRKQASDLIEALEVMPEPEEESEEVKKPTNPKYNEAVEAFEKVCADLGLDIEEEMSKAAKEMGRNSFQELSDVQIKLYTRGLNS